MKVVPSFPLPEEPPVVPEGLSERIIELQSDMTKVALKVSCHGGWKAVCTVHLDGSEDATEVYSTVKAAADYHCRCAGAVARYRAQIWALPPGQQSHVRHTVTFRCQPDGDDEPVIDTHAVQPTDGQHATNAMMEVNEFTLRLASNAQRQENAAIRAVLSQQQMQAEQLAPLTKLVGDCISMFRDGLRMKASALDELQALQAKVNQQALDSGQSDTSKLWEALTPALHIAAAKLGDRLLPGKEVPTRALPAKRELPAKPVSSGSPPSKPPKDGSTELVKEEATPSSLHELARALLDGISTERTLRLVRLLSPEQVGYLGALVDSTDDDTTADAVVALMQSLLENTATLVQFQQVLLPAQVSSFRSLALLATEHVNARAPTSDEAAPPGGGDAASSGTDDSE